MPYQEEVRPLQLERGMFQSPLRRHSMKMGARGSHEGTRYYLRTCPRAKRKKIVLIPPLEVMRYVGLFSDIVLVSLIAIEDKSRIN